MCVCVCVCVCVCARGICVYMHERACVCMNNLLRILMKEVTSGHEVESAMRRSTDLESSLRTRPGESRDQNEAGMRKKMSTGRTYLFCLNCVPSSRSTQVPEPLLPFHHQRSLWKEKKKYIYIYIYIYTV